MTNQIATRGKSQLGSLRKLINELKIRDLESDSDPIEEQLRYVFAIIGLKKLPNQDRPEKDIPSDKEVLLDFIQRNYGGYHPIEIRAAFELAIHGKLNIKPELVNHYQDFSCMYFGRIMAAYRPYREKLLSISINKPVVEKELTPKEKEENKRDSMEFYEGALLEKYDKLVADPDCYLFNKLDEQLAYYNLKRLGIKLMSDKERQEMFINERPKFMKHKYPNVIDKETRIHCTSKAFNLVIQQLAFEGFDLRAEIEKRL